jgi:bacterioferritin
MAKTEREKRKAKVIEVLNKARAMELAAITQYMNQHYNLDDMDYGELAAKVKLIAIDEMRHAEGFAERIKELGGEPTTEPDQKVTKGQKVEQIYPSMPAWRTIPSISTTSFFWCAAKTGTASP